MQMVPFISAPCGAYLPADIYVRFQRMLEKTFFSLCGSDEHGVPITLRAKKEGTTPQAIVDKYHSMMKKEFRRIRNLI
jgi:methionyl-tRNA synthetase